MSPRSILKNHGAPSLSHLAMNHEPQLAFRRPSHPPRAPSFTSALPYPDGEHRVHFPPSPSLTTLYAADPPSAYDRTPITVLPNSCALPARGCPGRTYVPSSPSCSGSKRSRSASHAHPAAFGYANALGIDTSPSLISDDGSSEDSDAPTTPPPELSYNPIPMAPSISSPYHRYSQSELDFLPHTPLSIPSPKYSAKLGLSERRKSSRPASFRPVAWGGDLACLGGF